jgi:hypothetical protein
MAASNATGLVGLVSKRLGWYVNHDDVLVRFLSLWIVVASVFTAAWILSYLFFPQGLLRGGNPGVSTGYTGSITGRSSGCSGGTSASP